MIAQIYSITVKEKGGHPLPGALVFSDNSGETPQGFVRAYHSSTNFMEVVLWAPLDVSDLVDVIVISEALTPDELYKQVEATMAGAELDIKKQWRDVLTNTFDEVNPEMASYLRSLCHCPDLN